MNSAGPIIQNKVLSSYSDQAIGNNAYFFTGVFFIGVFLTGVVPVTIYCASGGPVSPLVFGFVTVLGIALGVLRYNQTSQQDLTVIGTKNKPRPPQKGRENRNPTLAFTN